MIVELYCFRMSCSSVEELGSSSPISTLSLCLQLTPPRTPVRSGVSESAIFARTLAFREVAADRNLLHISSTSLVYRRRGHSYTSSPTPAPTLRRIVVKLARSATRAHALLEVAARETVLPMTLLAVLLLPRPARRRQRTARRRLFRRNRAAIW